MFIEQWLSEAEAKWLWIYFRQKGRCTHKHHTNNGKKKNISDTDLSAKAIFTPEFLRILLFPDLKGIRAPSTTRWIHCCRFPFALLPGHCGGSAQSERGQRICYLTVRQNLISDQTTCAERQNPLTQCLWGIPEPTIVKRVLEFGEGQRHSVD